MDQLEILIHDVGGPRRAARICGVHVSTVRRWRRGASPLPQSAYRALYGASHWGRSERSTLTANIAQALTNERDALKRRVVHLERELARVLLLADFGAANAPLFERLSS